MPSPTDDETPFPALSHAAGLNLNALDRSHLSPHDAFTYPLRQPYDGDGPADPLSHLRHLKDDRSRSRRRKRAWKKLMWVKQSCEFLSRLPHQLGIIHAFSELSQGRQTGG